MPHESNNEATVEAKKAIIDNEALMWKNTLYQMEMRARISVKIGDKEAVERLKTEIEKAIRWIEALKEERESLVGE